MTVVSTDEISLVLHRPVIIALVTSRDHENKGTLCSTYSAWNVLVVHVLVEAFPVLPFWNLVFTTVYMGTAAVKTIFIVGPCRILWQTHVINRASGMCIRRTANIAIINLCSVPLSGQLVLPHRMYVALKVLWPTTLSISCILLISVFLALSDATFSSAKNGDSYKIMCVSDSTWYYVLLGCKYKGDQLFSQRNTWQWYSEKLNKQIVQT